MSVIKLGEHSYNIGPLDVFSQLNIARRLTPVSPVIEGLTNPENEGKDFTILVILMLGKLRDEDSDFVIRKCLQAVRINTNDQWFPIVNAQGGLQYQHIGMKLMVDLATAVILENLGDFFRTALSAPVEQADQEKPV